jgi:hypothetical protein
MLAAMVVEAVIAQRAGQMKGLAQVEVGDITSRIYPESYGDPSRRYRRTKHDDNAHHAPTPRRRFPPCERPFAPATKPGHFLLDWGKFHWNLS